jgi:hypothetical protein
MFSLTLYNHWPVSRYFSNALVRCSHHSLSLLRGLGCSYCMCTSIGQSPDVSMFMFRCYEPPPQHPILISVRSCAASDVLVRSAHGLARFAMLLAVLFRCDEARSLGAPLSHHTRGETSHQPLHASKPRPIRVNTSTLAGQTRICRPSCNKFRSRRTF